MLRHKWDSSRTRRGLRVVVDVLYKKERRSSREGENQRTDDSEKKVEVEVAELCSMDK